MPGLIAAVKPITMLPSVCALTLSGLTCQPQSMTDTTFSIFNSPPDCLETVTQQALMLPKLLNTATPRPCPAGSFSFQFDFSAMTSKTFLKRSSFKRAKRASMGSCPAACASSSIKHSWPKAKFEAYTERHHTTGMSVLTLLQLSFQVGISYLWFSADNSPEIQSST